MSAAASPRLNGGRGCLVSELDKGISGLLRISVRLEYPLHLLSLAESSEPGWQSSDATC